MWFVRVGDWQELILLTTVKLIRMTGRQVTPKYISHSVLSGILIWTLITHINMSFGLIFSHFGCNSSEKPCCLSLILLVVIKDTKALHDTFRAKAFSTLLLIPWCLLICVTTRSCYSTHEVQKKWLKWINWLSSIEWREQPAPFITSGGI